MRITVVMTHPVQYMTPWFRYLASSQSEAIELMVLYAASPSSEQQGVGFGQAFEWDIPLTEGYPHRILSRSDDARFDSDSFFGIDVPEIKSAILQTKPDLVMIAGWHSVTQLRALWTCRKHDIPALYRGDSNLLTGRSGFSGLAWRVKSRYLLSLFEAWLAVGTRSHEYLVSLGCREDRIFSSPHAIDNDAFFHGATIRDDPTALGRLRQRYGIAPERFVLLYVGKLSPKKRPLDLIQALGNLKASEPETPGKASLVVAGSGELEPSCRALVSELDIDCQFLGFVNQGELPEVYALADVLVLPSSWGETWGLVVNEALASGVPCIVSDRVGCAPDLVVPGETGKVFNCGDIDSLADAIRDVRRWKHSASDLRSACQTHVSGFSFEQASRGLIDAGRELVENRRA